MNRIRMLALGTRLGAVIASSSLVFLGSGPVAAMPAAQHGQAPGNAAVGHGTPAPDTLAAFSLGSMHQLAAANEDSTLAEDADTNVDEQGEDEDQDEDAQGEDEHGDVDQDQNEDTDEDEDSAGDEDQDEDSDDEENSEDDEDADSEDHEDDSGDEGEDD